MITASEGGNLHLSDLRARAGRFRPDDARPLSGRRAGAGRLGHPGAAFPRLVPRAGLALFREVDILLAPATPCEAPLIGQETIEIDGTPVPARAVSRGLHAAAVVYRAAGRGGAAARHGGGLPIGVQIIAAPWREADALRVAASLERFGVTNAETADG